jgi:filamentous hemagglutinin family protein
MIVEAYNPSWFRGLFAGRLTQTEFHMAYRKSRFVNNSVIQMFVLMALAIASVPALAAPSGGNVVQGMASITYLPPVTRVELQTDDAVIEWQKFNLAVGETFEVVQPSLRSRLVNRVQQNRSSDLRGTIQSNGQVLILNADGILHRSSAIAIVGGLVLSGLDLAFESVMGNRVRLMNSDATKSGLVKNLGTIETADGGNAVLVGHRVLNRGLITGDLASVALAVGRDANILFEANGLISLNIDQEEPKAPAKSSAQLVNTGEIIVPSGRILLTGSRSSPVFKPLADTEVASDSRILVGSDAAFALGAGVKINNRGALDASNPYISDEFDRNGGVVVVIGDAIQHDALISVSTGVLGVAGHIVIAASSGVHLLKSNHLNAMADWHSIGGSIKILGKSIHICDGSLIVGDGGSIVIGGKSINPMSQLMDTADIVMRSEIRIFGEFIPGTIDIKATNTVDVAGYIMAQSYMGGAVEVVSGDRLKFNTVVEMRANSREPVSDGTLLLQAKDLLMTPGDGAWAINATKLDQGMNLAQVTLKADRDVALLGKRSTLKLNKHYHVSAGSNVRLNNVVAAGGGTFSAGNDLIIENSTIEGYFAGCPASANRDIYFTNSTFIDWCYAWEGLSAGGEIFITNSKYYPRMFETSPNDFD